MDYPKHQRHKYPLEDTRKKELLDLIANKSFGSCLVIPPFLFNHESTVNAEWKIDHHGHYGRDNNEEISLEHVVLVGN